MHCSGFQGQIGTVLFMSLSSFIPVVICYKPNSVVSQQTSVLNPTTVCNFLARLIQSTLVAYNCNFIGSLFVERFTKQIVCFLTGIILFNVCGQALIVINIDNNLDFFDPIGICHLIFRLRYLFRYINIIALA